MYMNFEKLEEMRHEVTETVMRSMAEFAADEKKPFEERLKAAAAVDSMSNNIIKANLLTNVVDANEKNVNKIGKQLDKLRDQDDA